MPVIRTFQQLGETLRQLPRKRGTLLVAIDGCGASGKSTFAQRMLRTLPDALVIHGDDFYLPSHLRQPNSGETIAADFDLRRLHQQVLEPLSRDELGNYQQYDWIRDELTSYKSVPAGGIVIIEGIYAMLPPLAELYDYTIWLECPYDTRLARGLARDGDSARDLWVNRWMPAEDRYVEMHQPLRKATLVVDASGAVEHIAENEFVVLEG